MEKASPSTPTAGPATPPQPELSRLGGAEVLKLKAEPVRRSLFGPVDHQQLQQDFQRLLCMDLEVAKKRWNFDFQREMPGEGSDIKWEELRYQDAPAFYRSRTVGPVPPRRPMSKSRSTSSSLSSSSSGNGSPGNGSSSGSGDEYLEVTTRGCYRVQRHGKRKQSAITDFFKVKKRKLLHYKASPLQ